MHRRTQPLGGLEELSKFFKLSTAFQVCMSALNLTTPFVFKWGYVGTENDIYSLNSAYFGSLSPASENLLNDDS